MDDSPKQPKLTGEEILSLIQFITGSVNSKQTMNTEKVETASTSKGAPTETTGLETFKPKPSIDLTKRKSSLDCFKLVSTPVKNSDKSKTNFQSKYLNLMDLKSLGNKILEMNNNLKLRNLVKIKDSQIVSPELYYLGPLLHAYGTSLNSKTVPPEIRAYLEHFSLGALGLLHIINKLGKFMKTSHLEGLFKDIPGKTEEKITLLFDLDETLAHCKLQNEGDESSSEVEIIIRPYAEKVLKSLKKNFELGLFTSSSQNYADMVLKRLDPKNEIFSFRFYKESCVDIGDGISIKDLRVIQQRKVSSVFLVDNNPYCYGLQLTQGIPIIPFFGNPTDTELLKLEIYLSLLAGRKDSASFNTKYFGHDILLNQIKDNLNNLPGLMLERILEVANGMSSLKY